MNRIALAVAAATVILAFNTTSALAQSVRTFVSGHGTDTGICGVGSPCRTFAYAIGQTAASGEIVVLDSAGYGTVLINKAISITNEGGVEAAITVGAGAGITVAAGAGDTVNLTGITLTGNGGVDGVVFESGATLNIQNCVARGFSNDGINLTPNTAGASVNVSDTIIANNEVNGIYFGPSISASGFFQRVQAYGNSNIGIAVDGFQAPLNATVVVIARDSAAAGNHYGFFVSGFSAPVTTTMTLVNDTAFKNGTGLVAGIETMILAQTTVSGNGVGYNIMDGGTIKSFGNNYIVDTNNGGALTAIGPQ